MSERELSSANGARVKKKESFYNPRRDFNGGGVDSSAAFSVVNGRYGYGEVSNISANENTERSFVNGERRGINSRNVNQIFPETITVDGRRAEASNARRQ